MTSARRGALAASAFLCLMVVGSAATPAVAQIADLPGSRDPAGLKRYEGSVVIGYTFKRFDEFTFMVGPVTRQKTTGAYAPLKTQRAEGQRTRLVYVAPESRSSLEVLRNYEHELASAGYQTIYRCRGAECGTDDGGLADRYLYTMDTRLSQTPAAGSGRPPGQISAYAFGNARDQYFLAAKRSGAQGDAWISVYVATSGFELHKETFGHAIVLVDLVESGAMDAKMVTVDAVAMARDIAATGHVALYGILFDTDKTTIKTESAATIAEIATFLARHPTVKLYVVGHTDNVGVYDYNIGLSQRRAAAVVQELAVRHRVDPSRLKPAGTGPLAPVAPNDTDEGRARNRRVELVKQ